MGFRKSEFCGKGSIPFVTMFKIHFIRSRTVEKYVIDSKRLKKIFKSYWSNDFFNALINLISKQ